MNFKKVISNSSCKLENHNCKHTVELRYRKPTVHVRIPLEPLLFCVTEAAAALDHTVEQQRPKCHFRMWSTIYTSRSTPVQAKAKIIFLLVVGRSCEKEKFASSITAVSVWISIVIISRQIFSQKTKRTRFRSSKNVSCHHFHLFGWKMLLLFVVSMTSSKVQKL